MKIGERAKLRRKELGITQAALAKALKITQAAISRWEDGTVSNIRPENLLAAADILKVDVNWLVTGKHKSPTEHPTPEPAQTGMLLKLPEDLESDILKAAQRAGHDLYEEVIIRLRDSFIDDPASVETMRRIAREEIQRHHAKQA